jgi:serine/threonine protein kinase
MSALDHPNLVKFYGITLNPLRMVMEFVSHGDLYHMLQDKSISDEALSWTFRMKIALDIAKGMRHLQAVTPPIIHRDLRSPNILVRRLHCSIIAAQVF